MKRKFFIYTGLLLILSSLFLSIYNYYFENIIRNNSKNISYEINEYINNQSTWKDIYKEIPEMEMPSFTVDGNQYIGILEIDKLNLYLPILKECSEENLKIAPCRYIGSIYMNDMVICAHNYRNHFSKLNILEKGDQVIFKDIDGNQFIYEVSSKEIIEPTNINKVTSNNYDLTLFTCTTGGYYRIVIYCNQINPV